MSNTNEGFAYVLPENAVEGQTPGKVAVRSLGHWLEKGFREVTRTGESLAATTDEGDTSRVETPESTSTPSGELENGTAADDADITDPASAPRTTGRAGKGR